jgi:glutamine synthetase
MNVIGTEITAEYIWLDGYKPEPNLRSKVKILKEWKGHRFTADFYPEWSFDGSSTRQAEGHYSDRVLKPVKVYKNPFQHGDYHFFVLCEVWNPDGTPHESNVRHLLRDHDQIWYGFEQEYTILQDGRPLGFPVNGYPKPQGTYYCGVGSNQVHGRQFVEEHLNLCLKAGLNITGINAEVLLGQWEFQILGESSLEAADDLWMARYILQRLSEKYRYNIEFHPKPVEGDWNGSGLHCNFSNQKMRTSGGEQYFKSILKAFEIRHDLHIENYGSSNELRLTGKHETQSIDKFSWGVSDRGASIRVPLKTASEWKGYLEDRRPASNADPYKIVKVISETLSASETMIATHKLMYDDVNISNLKNKYSTLSNDDLLSEYKKDNEIESLEYDTCGICGIKTRQLKSAHIDTRIGYVEGAGQGCDGSCGTFK